VQQQNSTDDRFHVHRLWRKDKLPIDRSVPATAFAHLRPPGCHARECPPAANYRSHTAPTQPHLRLNSGPRPMANVIVAAAQGMKPRRPYSVNTIHLSMSALISVNGRRQEFCTPRGDSTL
jgi:hypothetical protein